MLRKGLALVQDHKPQAAMDVFDAVVEMCATTDSTGMVAKATSALLSKASALLLQGESLTDNDFSSLLGFLAKEGEMRPGVVQALTQLSFNYGLPRALEIIQDSPSAGLLLPLETAIKQELGRETYVANEVREVAADIRRDLPEIGSLSRLDDAARSAERIGWHLKGEVNLNQSRLDRLETSVGAVNDYLKGNLSWVPEDGEAGFLCPGYPHQAGGRQRRVRRRHPDRDEPQPQLGSERLRSRDQQDADG